MSMMVSFVLSFFPRDVLDEILNLIESVSEDFLTTQQSTNELGVNSFFTNTFNNVQECNKINWSACQFSALLLLYYSYIAKG